MGDQTVSQLDRVAERLHGQRPLRQTWQIEKVRDGAERENKMIVFERVRVAIEPMRNNDLFVFEIDALHVADRRNSRGASSCERD